MQYASPNKDQFQYLALDHVPSFSTQTVYIVIIDIQANPLAVVMVR